MQAREVAGGHQAPVAAFLADGAAEDKVRGRRTAEEGRGKGGWGCMSTSGRVGEAGGSRGGTEARSGRGYWVREAQRWRRE